MTPLKWLNKLFGIAGSLFNKFDGSAELLDDLTDHCEYHVCIRPTVIAHTQLRRVRRHTQDRTQCSREPSSRLRPQKAHSDHNFERRRPPCLHRALLLQGLAWDTTSKSLLPPAAGKRTHSAIFRILITGIWLTSSPARSQMPLRPRLSPTSSISATSCTTLTSTRMRTSWTSSARTRMAR